MPELHYIGIRPESTAKVYKERQYSHTDKRGVRFYHCWKTYKDLSSFSEDELEKHKVKKLNRLLLGKKPKKKK